MRRTDILNLKQKGITGELYTIDDSSECPCLEVYGQHSPEWHFEHPTAEECENGYLNEWSYETVYFKILQTDMSTDIKPAGILAKKSLRVFGFINADLEEIDLSELNRTNSYIIIDSEKYLITGISKDILQNAIRDIVDLECSQ